MTRRQRRRPRSSPSAGASSGRHLVLRLLRGEPLDAVSRESQVPAHELEGWKRVFLETGARGLKNRTDPEERELTLARAKIR
jgi:transposase